MASTLPLKSVARPIKTYTRPTKIKEESTSFLGELPVEYEGACRLCLDPSGNMTRIFHESNSIIPIKIRSILTIEVDEDDQLPAVICESCLFLLNETYSFKKRSIANDAKLRQYLRKSATVVSKPSLFEDIPVKSDDDDHMFSLDVEKEDCTVEWDEQNPLAGVIESLQPVLTTNLAKPEEPAAETDLNLPETTTFATLTPLEVNSSNGDCIKPDHTYDKCQENVNSAEKVVREQEKRLGPYERIELVSSEEELSGDEGEAEDLPLVERLIKEKREREPHFSCVKCKRYYETRIELHNHRKNCILKEICVMCPKSFVSRSLLLRHMRTHTGEKPYECEFCSATFSQKEILLRHIAQIHATVRPYECKLCGKCFAIPSLLTGHIKASHDSSRKYTCHLCGKEFNHCSGLSRHRGTHEDIYYCCKICKRRFTDVSSVKRHVKLCHWDVLAKQGFSKPTSYGKPLSESESQSQNEFTLTLIEKRGGNLNEQEVHIPIDGTKDLSHKISQVQNKESVKNPTPAKKGVANEIVKQSSLKRKLPLPSETPKKSRGRPRKSELPKSDLSSNKSNSLGMNETILQPPVLRVSRQKLRARSAQRLETNTQGEEALIKDKNSSLSELVEKETPPVLKKPRGRPRKSVSEATEQEPSKNVTNSPELAQTESNIVSTDSLESSAVSQPVDEMENCELFSKESTPILKKPRGRPKKSSLQVIPTSRLINSPDNKTAVRPNPSKDSVESKTVLQVDETNSKGIDPLSPKGTNAHEAKDVQNSSKKDTLSNSEQQEKESPPVANRPRGRPKKSVTEADKSALKVAESSDITTAESTKRSSTESLESKTTSQVSNETNSENMKSAESVKSCQQEYEELLAESEGASIAIVKVLGNLESSLKPKVISPKKCDKFQEQPKTDSSSQEKTENV